MAGTFQLTYVPGYTLSDSSRGFSNSAVVLTKTTTTARFPCSSSSLYHKLNVRLTCAPNTRRPFVCRASSGERDSERETALRERFEKWCQTHGVVYGGKEEWLRRFEIYKTNLQHIDYHNSLNLSSKLSDNKFADLTEAEFRARYCGARVKTPEVVSEYEKHDESDFDSEHGPVTAILEPESELQLDSHQEEEEEEENVTLDVLSDDEEVGDEAVESENSSLERPAK